jgi:hypothetical protein
MVMNVSASFKMDAEEVPPRGPGNSLLPSKHFVYVPFPADSEYRAMTFEPEVIY